MTKFDATFVQQFYNREYQMFRMLKMKRVIFQRKEKREKKTKKRKGMLGFNFNYFVFQNILEILYTLMEIKMI